MSQLIDLSYLILGWHTLGAFLLFVFTSLTLGLYAERVFCSQQNSARIPVYLLLGTAIWYALSSYMGFLWVYGKTSLFLTAVSVSLIGLFLIRNLTRERNTVFQVGRFSAIDWAAIAVVISYLPLAADSPHRWDDMMYHLPHARAWFESGEIFANTNFRYPLFPLAPSALTAWWMSTGTALIGKWANMLCFASVAFLLYQVMRKYAPAWLSLVVLVAWGEAPESYVVGSGFVDIPLTAMITASVFFSIKFRESNLLSDLLYSAFFAGTALSIKYQAALYLFVPCLWSFALAGSFRRASLYIFALFAPCIGWYVRAYLVSGDPVHPFGAEIFGYWVWNAADMQGQFNDLTKVKEWPPFFIFLGLSVVVYWPRLDQKTRLALCLGWIWVAEWILISGYPRYLTPAYPLLLFLTGVFIWRSMLKTARIFNRDNGYFQGVSVGLRNLALSNWAFVGSNIFVAMIMVLSLVNTYISSKWVFLSSSALHQAYVERYPLYALASKFELDVDAETRRIYKVLGGDQTFLLSSAVIGDHFGEHRLKGFVPLTSGSPSALEEYLLKHRIAYLLVEKSGNWAKQMADSLGTNKLTCLIGESDAAALFAIRTADNQGLCNDSSLLTGGTGAH